MMNGRGDRAWGFVSAVVVIEESIPGSVVRIFQGLSRCKMFFKSVNSSSGMVL